MSNPKRSNEKDKVGEKRVNPPDEESISQADLKRIMSEAVAAQLPRLILETSKVVSEQLAEQNESRSLATVNQEMRAIRQRQEELSTETKAASLKSEGKIVRSRNSSLYALRL